MPTYQLYLYDSTGAERAVVYVCRARSVAQLHKKLPTIVASHRGGRRHACLYDGWTIMGRPKPDNLVRNLAAGGIHNGRITDTSPAEHRVARQRASRAS